MPNPFTRLPRPLLKRGSLARSIPDYYSELAAGGFVNVAAVAAKFSFASLLNNAVAGELLQVWSVSVGGGTAAQNTGMYIVQGPGPNAYAPGIPVNGVGSKVPPGIYGGQATNSNPWSPYIFYGIVTGPQTWDWHGQFPLCILPPGYNLVIANVAVDLNLQVGFWWIAVPPLVTA